MPLCPQITNTPITVTQTADFTVTSVTPVVTATSSDVAVVQASANGKNVITYSSAAPSGSGTRVGDIWWQYSGSTLIGQSAWSGSAWINAPITDAVIANIDAAKITTGFLDVANRIQAGTIDAGKITASSITASQIAASTITATQIAASTITAAKLATGTLSATNIETGTLSASVALTAESGTIGGWNISTDKIYTGTLASPNQQISSAGGALFTGTTTCSALGVNSNLTVGGTIVGSSSVTSNGDLSTPNHTSTSNAANGYVFTTGGRVTRSTASSSRYKENIVDLLSVPELDPKKLLDLPVRAFSYKTTYLNANDDRAEMLMPGLIAEEVDAIYPVAADYVDGVENFNDRMILVGLLSLVQDLSKRVAELEAR